MRRSRWNRERSNIQPRMTVPITEFRYRTYRAMFCQVNRTLQEARGGVVYSWTAKNMTSLRRRFNFNLNRLRNWREARTTEDNQRWDCDASKKLSAVNLHFLFLHETIRGYFRETDEAMQPKLPQSSSLLLKDLSQYITTYHRHENLSSRRGLTSYYSWRAETSKRILWISGCRH